MTYRRTSSQSRLRSPQPALRTTRPCRTLRHRAKSRKRRCPTTSSSTTSRQPSPKQPRQPRGRLRTLPRLRRRCHHGLRRRLPYPHPARAQRDRARHRPRTAPRWHRAPIPRGRGHREAHRRGRDPHRHRANTHQGNTHRGNTHPGRVDLAAQVSHRDRRPSSSTGREARADQEATRRGPAEKGLDPSDHEES